MSLQPADRPEAPAVPVPRYGTGGLCDLLPSVAAGLGVPGETNALELEPARRACVLLIDGLGWELLRAHAQQAPYLAGLLGTSWAGSGQPITVGFPATTATSLGSLGTGLPPGRHGLVGYSAAVPGQGWLMNHLHWDPRIAPGVWQPYGTVFQRAETDGVAVAQVSPVRFETSGLTLAALQGGRYVGADDGGDRADRAAGLLAHGERSLVYVYCWELDAVGHLCGTGSEQWRATLAYIDELARRLARQLPRDAVLYVTADHGMVDVAPEDRVDFDAVPELAEGVALLGGEARARHLYTRPGAAGDVLAAWRDRLGERMWIRSRDEAIEAGWFGPRVDDRVRGRIGDVVAAAHAPVAVVATRREPKESKVVGMHGSMTPAEQLVPLLEVRGSG